MLLNNFFKWEYFGWPGVPASLNVPAVVGQTINDLISLGRATVLNVNNVENLWTDIQRTSPAQVGDRVLSVGSVGGTVYLTEGTVGEAPYLRQDQNGDHYLEFDGSNDLLTAEPVSTTETSTEFTIAYSARISAVETYGRVRPFGFIAGDDLRDENSFFAAGDGSLRFDGNFKEGSQAVPVGTRFTRLSKRSQNLVSDYIDGVPNIENSNVSTLGPTHLNLSVRADNTGQTDMRLYAAVFINGASTEEEDAIVTDWLSSNLDAISFTPPPQPPAQVTGLAVNPGNNANAISWAAPTETPDTLTLRVNSDGGAFADLQTVPGDTTFFQHIGLTNDVEFGYEIIATKGGLNSTVSSRAYGTPIAPSGMSSMQTSITSTSNRGYAATAHFFEMDGTTPADVEVGVDEGGHVFMSSDRASAFIMRFTPSSGPDANGNIVNGVMRNPDLFDDVTQGFNQNMEGSGDGNPLPYSSALNAGLSDIVINPSDEGCYVVAVANPNYSTTRTNTVHDYIDFTVMSSIPSVPFWCAPIIQEDKSPFALSSEFDITRLPSHPTPSSNALDLASLTHPHVNMEFAACIPNGEHRNRASIGNYSRYDMESRVRLLYAMIQDTANPIIREQRAKEWVSHGIQLYGALQKTGWSGAGGAGQSFGRHMYLMVAAFLLGRADMLPLSLAFSSQALAPGDQIYFKAEKHINTAEGSIIQWKNNDGETPYEFAPGEVGDLHVEPAGGGSGVVHRYSDIAYSGYLLEVFVMYLFMNGPNGKSLAQEVLERDGNPVADKSNPRFALIAAMDVFWSWRKFDPWAVPAWFISYYIAWRQYHPYPVYDTDRPSRLVVRTTDVGGTTKGLKVGPEPNGISYNDTELFNDFTVAPRTELKIGVSHGGLQWIDYVVPSGSGTVNVPTKSSLFVSALSSNVNGEGFRSAYRRAGGSGARAYDAEPVVTPEGVDPVSAPAFVVAPTLVYDVMNKQWPGFIYDPVTSASQTVAVTCGEGLVSGYPAPVYPDDFEVTPEVDGVLQAPLASPLDSFELPPGTTVRLRQAVTTSEGTAVAFTDPVVVPAAAPLPAGVIVDVTNTPTEWRDQRAFWDSLAGNYGVTGDLDTNLRARRGDTYSVGVTRFVNSAGISSPRAFLRSPTRLVSGTTYRFRLLFNVNGAVNDVRLWLADRDQGGDPVTPTTTLTDTSAFIEYVVDYTPTTNADIQMVVWCTTGGSPGGDFDLLEYSVKPV